MPVEQQLVVFRLGALAGVRDAGTTWLLPLVDRGVIVDMRTQTHTIPRLELLLHDRTKLPVRIEYKFRVTDAVVSVMNVAQPMEALQQLIMTTLQTLAAHQTRGDFWIAREELEKEMVVRTREAAASWGIEVMSVSVGEAQ